MSLEFTQDRRRRERRELQIPLRLEAFDGLEESDQRDLAQIVEGFSPVEETSSEVLGKPDVCLDKLVADATVAGAPTFDEASAPGSTRRGPRIRAHDTLARHEPSLDRLPSALAHSV